MAIKKAASAVVMKNDSAGSRIAKRAKPKKMGLRASATAASSPAGGSNIASPSAAVTTTWPMLKPAVGSLTASSVGPITLIAAAITQ